MRICAILLFILATSVDTYEILGFFEVPVRSHYEFASPILNELARRGHNLTIYSVYPFQVEDWPNLNVVDITTCFPVQLMNVPLNFEITVVEWLESLIAEVPKYEIISNCSIIMDLIRSTDTYDAFLTDICFPTWHTMFAYKFDIPLINIFPNALFPEIANVMGTPSNPSYIPTYFGDSTSRMNFVERMRNFYTHFMLTVGSSYCLSDRVNTLSRRLFGDNVPSVEEMVKNTSLALVNVDFDYHSAIPLAPNVISVAGIQLKEAKSLPVVSFICVMVPT